MTKERKLVASALFLFLLSLYLLTYSGAVDSSDSLSMLSVTESVVKRGDYDTNQILWMGLQQGTFGRGGELYSRKGLGNSLAALPLAWIGQVTPFWGFVQTALLLNVIVTALSGLLVFLYIERLGYSTRSSLAVSLLFALGTMAWPYSKYCFGEPLTGLGLLGAAYFLLRFRDSRGLGETAIAGSLLGLAITARQATAAVTPLFIVALLAYAPRKEGEGIGSYIRRLLPPLMAFLLPLALWGGVNLTYNYLRFEDIFVTGYLPQESFRTPLHIGLLGLLVSPGRSIFLYCPIFLALPWALPSFLRRHRLEAFLCLSLSLAFLLLYAKWFMWHGGFAWGPRFLVPILPFLVIPLAPLVERAKGRSAWALGLLGTLSVAMQVLGLSVAFGLFQEILLQTGLPLFALVTFFHPRYSPILGQLALLRPENLDFAWSQPQMDWLVLSLSLLLVLLSSLALAYGLRKATSKRYGTSLLALGLLILGITGFNLTRYEYEGGQDFAPLARFIEGHSQANDVIIFNSPAETAALQNYYKGSLPVYGLFEGGPPLPPERARLLQSLAARHQRIWLIPGQSGRGLEAWLSQEGYRAYDEPFGEERLALYFFPSPPLEERTTQALFGDKISLEGYGYSPEVRGGEVLPVSLHWRALAKVEEDYQVFVHLVDGGGEIQAQQDGTPLLGSRPTSSWRPNEEIRDRYALFLSTELEPGQYRLLVGFYRLSDGQRLPLAEGGDSLSLGSVTVK